MPNLAEILNSKKTVFIGSSPENDIVLNDSEVSPIHCQISKVKNGVYMVVDLESATGTFINDTKITKGFAGTYDTIKVGNHVFQLNEEAKEREVSGEQLPAVTNPVSYPPTEPDWMGNKQAATSPEKVETKTVDHTPSNTNTGKNKIVVYFLAAPEDEATCEAVYKHLSTIKFSSPLPIEMIGEFKLTGGEEIATYREQVNNADIFLAFVSVDFLNNNNCYELLKTVIDKHNQRKAILLPILVRNCMWKTTPFANLPLLPKNHQPLNNKQYWNSEDDALTNVADDIFQSISSFTKNSTPDKPLLVTDNTTLKTNWRSDYLWKNFWKRTAAYLLDILIIFVPMFFVLYLVFGEDFFNEAREKAIVFGLINTGLLILIYSFFDSSKWRGTPGKYIMKLQITDDVGNPISFEKALKRNAFKFFLFGFVGGLDESGVISIVLLIGQIGCYIATKKFIHDYLTHTIIGERLKGETMVTKTAANPEGKSSNIVVAHRGSKSMALTISGIIALVCIVFFLVSKVVANDNTSQSQPITDNQSDISNQVPVNLPAKEGELTEEKKASLIKAIDLANTTEAEAYQKWNADILQQAFTGNKLTEVLSILQQLKERRTFLVSELQDEQFHSFNLSDDGQNAEVRVTQTWNGVIYSADNNGCLGRIPSYTAPQTIFLQQVNDVWLVYNVIVDNPGQPQTIPCN